MPFSLDEFVASCKALSDPSDPTRSIEQLRTLLEGVVAHPEQVQSAIPNTGDDEVLLHQDDSCTVYIVRVPVGILYPPHDHRMPAVIGVFEGAEVNHMFRVDAEGCIQRDGSRTISVGETFVLSTEAVHAISTNGVSRSQALHVYIGNLGAMTRSLYNPDTGSEVPFNEANYFNLAQHLDEIATS